MPEYLETTAQATTSRRAFAVHIILPRNDPTERRIVYEEEEITVINGRVSKLIAGRVSAPIVASDTFAVINPITGVPTGATATVGTLYALVMSHYADLSAKRDALPPP
jgi:hypothetical protein